MITRNEVERIRNSDLPGSARHIFYELSIRANKEGVAWPSIKTIAHDTGYSENHIRKMLRLLEESRWINIIQRPKTSNMYEIRPVKNGPGKPLHRVNPPPAPRAVSPPAPRDVTTAPGDDKALQETELPHEDLKDHNEGIDQIRRAWQDRNPPYFQLDVNQARQLMNRYTAAEIINAINSYEYVNDLNPYQIGNRIEILRDFPEFSHKNGAKNSQKTAKKEGKIR